MPNSNLAAYLAKNYLTASRPTSSHPDGHVDFADSTRPKKKRKKNKERGGADGDGGGLIIADDDEDLSLRNLSGTRGDGDDGNDGPVFETGVKSAEFRKKKSGSGWKVVSEPTTNTNTTTARDDATTSRDDPTGGDAEADQVLAEAEQEARLRQRALDDEDAPAIVDTGGTGDGDTPVMASGVRAGLQTAADTAALIAREKEREEREQRDLERARRKKKASKKDAHDNETEAVPEEEQTIYRDATGRRIDISMKRAEARAAEQEKLRAERKAREDAMGEVQRREKEARKQQLEEAKFMTLARGADDEEMNDMLRKQKRWDDPMAGYIAQKEQEDEEEPEQETGPEGRVAGGRSGKDQDLAKKTTVGAKQKQRKVYAGHAPPNRYGILPGWRWDGVDRSTGFEKEWFQARSKSARVEELKYQWQMDD